MGVPRPIPPDGGITQEEQAGLVRETGNEATEADEENVLASLYGAPDADGVYRGGDGG